MALLALLCLTEPTDAVPYASEPILTAAIPVFDNKLMESEFRDYVPELFDDFVAEVQSLSGVPYVYSDESAAAIDRSGTDEDDSCPTIDHTARDDGSPSYGSPASRLQHIENLKYLSADCLRASTADVVLVGDSVASRWIDGAFQSLCEKSGGNCLNLAVSGQRTAQLPFSVLDYTRTTCLSPKLWIIQSGADEIVDRGGSVKAVTDVTRNILSTVEIIRSEHCQSEVLVLGLNPITAHSGSSGVSYDFLNSPLRPAITSVNEALAQSLFKPRVLGSLVSFASCEHRLLDDNANQVLPGALPDGRQLSTAGYDLLTSCLNALLSRVPSLAKPTYRRTGAAEVFEDLLAGLLSSRYQWAYGPWQCSATSCGKEGRLVRSADYCQDTSTASPVDTSLCTTEPQQEQIEAGACRAPACRDVEALWVVSPWGYCSLSCGGGVQNRTVECLTGDNQVVSEQRCLDAVGVTPSLSRSCDQQICSDAGKDEAADMYLYDEDGDIIGIRNDRVAVNGVQIMSGSSSSESQSSEEKKKSSSRERSSSDDRSSDDSDDDSSSGSKRSSEDSSASDDDSSESEETSSNDSHDDSDKSSKSSDDDSSSSDDDDDDNGSSSSNDDDDSSASYSTRSSGRCSRCRRGDVGPWYVEKRLWYQVVWQGSKICLKGCYKHEDARSGKTYCSSKSGAPKGGCKRSNIERCKKWSGCHDDVDYFVPTCDTCAYLGLNRKTVSTRLVASIYGECTSGVIAVNSTCCPVGSVLDAVGDCCPAGVVDACGVCGGSSTVVDMLGQCCKGSQLAADGLCCTNAEVDTCGVCGGMGTTCSMRANVQLTAPSVSGFQVAATKAVPSELAIAQSLSPLDIAVDIDNMMVVQTTNAREVQVSGNVSFTMLPFERLSVASLVAEVDGVGATLMDVHYDGVCSNGICEVGEQTRGRRQGSCEFDCAFPEMLSCQCGDRGKCIPTSGTCECFVGYEGDWCQDCAHRFTPLGDICVPYIEALRGDVTIRTPDLLLGDDSFQSSVGAVAETDVNRVRVLVLILAILAMCLAMSFGALLAWHISFRRQESTE